jgi:hypothetical protein
VPSALITKKTDAIAFDFAKKQLFEPLGITTAKWGQAVSTRKAPPLAERGCRWPPHEMAPNSLSPRSQGERDMESRLPLRRGVDRARAANVPATLGYDYTNYM